MDKFESVTRRSCSFYLELQAKMFLAADEAKMLGTCVVLNGEWVAVDACPESQRKSRSGSVVL